MLQQVLHQLSVFILEAPAKLELLGCSPLAISTRYEFMPL
jgi:hypothetical protein